MPSPGPDRFVAELVWRALRDPHGYDWYRQELRIVAASAREAAALLPYLAGVRVDEWSGESGVPYRDYLGRLPCGLALRVSTDAGLVPDLTGGGR